jgi:hypothetical protein
MIANPKKQLKEAMNDDGDDYDTEEPCEDDNEVAHEE